MHQQQMQPIYIKSTKFNFIIITILQTCMSLDKIFLPSSSYHTANQQTVYKQKSFIAKAPDKKYALSPLSKSTDSKQMDELIKHYQNHFHHSIRKFSSPTLSINFKPLSQQSMQNSHQIHRSSEKDHFRADGSSILRGISRKRNDKKVLEPPFVTRLKQKKADHQYLRKKKMGDKDEEFEYKRWQRKQEKKFLFSKQKMLDIIESIKRQCSKNKQFKKTSIDSVTYIPKANELDPLIEQGVQTKGIKLQNCLMDKERQKKKQIKILNQLRQSRRMKKNIKGLAIATEPSELFETKNAIRSVSPWIKKDRTAQQQFYGDHYPPSPF